MRSESPAARQPGRAARGQLGGWRRLVFAYVCVLLGLIPVALGAVAGLVLANRCDAPGFECLGVLFAGPMIGAGVGVLMLFVVAIRYGLGWVWVLLTLLLFAAAAMVSGMLLPLTFALVLSAPALAALTTDPTDHGRVPRWALGAVAALAVVVLSVAIAGAMQIQESRTQQRLLREAGIEPVDLQTQEWSYRSLLIGSDRGSGVGYTRYTVRHDEQAVVVRLTRVGNSDLDPPRDCSDDPATKVACREVSPGVFTDPDSYRETRVVVVGQTVVLLRDDTPGADLEGTGVLDELAADLRPVTPATLTEHFCLTCRLLPGG